MSDRFDELARETIATWRRFGCAVEPSALAGLLRDTDANSERRGELKGLEWAMDITEDRGRCALPLFAARIAELKKGET